MESGCLRVRTLGQLSLEWAGNRITDGENRSKKVWLLLACLIDSRGRPVTAEELTRILWEAEPCRSTNPPNALKAILHRARASLDLLEPDLGRRRGTPGTPRSPWRWTRRNFSGSAAGGSWPGRRRSG